MAFIFIRQWSRPSDCLLVSPISVPNHHINSPSSSLCGCSLKVLFVSVPGLLGTLVSTFGFQQPKVLVSGNQADSQQSC